MTLAHAFVIQKTKLMKSWSVMWDLVGEEMGVWCRGERKIRRQRGVIRCTIDILYAWVKLSVSI